MKQKKKVEESVTESKPEPEPEPTPVPEETKQETPAPEPPKDNNGEENPPLDDDDDDLPPDPDDDPPDDTPVDTSRLPDEEDEDDLEDELPDAEEGGQGQLSLVDVRQSWLELSDLVNREKRGLGYHLEQGAPTSMDNGALEITFEAENKFDSSQILKNRDMLGRVFRQKYGISKRIVIQTGTIPESARPPKRKSEEELFNEKFDSYLKKNPVWNEMVKRLELKFNDR